MLFETFLRLLEQTRIDIGMGQGMGHFNRDFIAFNNHRTKSNRHIVCQDNNLFIILGIKLDHRPSPHTKQLMDRHIAAAEHNGQINFNIINKAHGFSQIQQLTFTTFSCTGYQMVNRLLTKPVARSFASQDVEWRVSSGLIDYEDAIRHMESRVAKIRAGELPEQIWLLEHPPLYTAGTSAQDTDLVDPNRFPVHQTGRGGQYTYHGPGQRVAYVMLDLTKRGSDVRAFVGALEEWIISTLAEFDISGERRHDRVGVWVSRPEKNPGSEDKIAALGIRVRRGITYHGISINCDPELEHFDGIVPCGIHGHGVTSFKDLGNEATMTDLDIVLRTKFEEIFGTTVQTD